MFCSFLLLNAVSGNLWFYRAGRDSRKVSVFSLNHAVISLQDILVRGTTCVCCEENCKEAWKCGGSNHIDPQKTSRRISHPYQTIVVQELYPSDFQNRFACSRRWLDVIPWNVVYYSSDAVYFHLSNCVSNLNIRSDQRLTRMNFSRTLYIAIKWLYEVQFLLTAYFLRWL